MCADSVQPTHLYMWGREIYQYVFRRQPPCLPTIEAAVAAVVVAPASKPCAPAALAGQGRCNLRAPAKAGAGPCCTGGK